MYANQLFYVSTEFYATKQYIYDKEKHYTLKESHFAYTHYFPLSRIVERSVRDDTDAFLYMDMLRTWVMT